eukprot:scaffold23261_cov113-Isochrysis_galbana.AAC.2
MVGPMQHLRRAGAGERAPRRAMACACALAKRLSGVASRGRATSDAAPRACVRGAAPASIPEGAAVR